MRRFISVFIALTLIGVGVLLMYTYSRSFKFKGVQESEIEFNNSFIFEEKACLNFIEREMVSEGGGIYTNFLDSDNVQPYASGHEVLSESEGLIMIYYVKNNKKEKFDLHYEYVNKNMLLDSGLIRWRIREGNKDLSKSSAAIDDLRIARALIYAYNLWDDRKYLSTLKKINKGLIRYSVKDDYLTDYYEENFSYTSDQITLSYMDLFTIKQLSVLDKEWNKIYEKGLEVIRNGFISDSLPLYQKTYKISEGKYIKEDYINIIDSMLVVMHLSEVGLARRESIEWIRNQIYDREGIYSKYSIETGEPLDTQESTAVYAIAARIAKNIGDKSLHCELIEKMLALQVKDKGSRLYGSFGDIRTLKVYSFDNLQALLAF
jgi:endo-1,4-beta-D-glucanase Y